MARRLLAQTKARQQRFAGFLRAVVDLANGGGDGVAAAMTVMTGSIESVLPMVEESRSDTSLRSIAVERGVHEV